MAPKAIFLSYASQDTAAAQRICDALRAAGVEVWFDQNELVGGDAWDAKIRKQIKDCALFMPIISANTQARAEGYFRREWKLAVERTHDMADHVAFLVPVVIDQTGDAEAFVPEKFREVQWTRLLGGEATPKFCARVQSLLRGGPPPQPAAPASSMARSKSPAQSRARWFTPAIAGLVVVAVIGTWLWLGRPIPSAPPPAKGDATTATTAAKATSAPLTEAQKLVAQARQVYEGGDEISRENLFYAEELVQKALTLDPAEASAWEFGAWTSYFLGWHGFDDSEARRETMMRRVARAKALLPDSIQVRVCELTVRLFLAFVGARQRALENPDIERELLALLERDPGNWLAHRALGICYRLMNRPDDSAREFRRAIELSGGKPMAVGDLLNLWIRANRYDEAERLLAETLPRQTSGRLLTFDSIVQTRWRGDAAGALRAVETWPSWFVREDRAIALAWQAAMWARNPQRALAAVLQARTDYVRDVNFSGPRAVLSARAHELAGNHEAAQTDWRVVLQRCEQDFAANPQDIPALCWKSWALARLGDRAGAQAAATLLRQRADSAASNYFTVMSRAQLWATVGWTDLAIEELGREKVGLDRYTMTRAYLELEPAFDPIRADPRFMALVAAAPAPAAPAPGAATAKSIAVLPFANVGGDKDNEAFSDGISDELISVLGRVPGLTVKARTSSFFFKGSNASAREKGQKLGATYLVDGSVRRIGGTVRITAQLIRAETEENVWSSEPLMGDTKDVFAVQEKIAGLIAQTLSLKLGAGSASATTAVKPEAFELYVQARAAWNLRTGEGYDRAERMLLRALTFEPGFARAHSALADVWLLRGQDSNHLGRFGDRDSALLRQVLAKAKQAVELDPGSAEAHASLGNAQWNGWLHADAERSLRHAIKLNASYASAHQWLGRVLLDLGRIDEAIAELRIATELDPLSSRIADNCGLAYRRAGRLTEALGYYDRALALRPDSHQALTQKGITLAALGRKDEAAALIRTIPGASWPTPDNRVEVLAEAGLRADAEARLAELDPERKDIARLLLLIGKPDQALTRLNPDSVLSMTNQQWLYDPAIDPIRQEPRFASFLATLGLTEAHARAQAWRAANPPEKVGNKR